MANLITRDSFDDAANRVEVVNFAGSGVVDSDLNEGRKILWVNTAEQAAANNSPLRAAGSTSPSYGVAEGNAWQVYANGTADMFIRAGTLFVDGMRITLSGDISLVAQGFTFGTVGGSNVYGLVVLDFVITQVDGSSDSTILVPNVGSVSERYVITPTYRQAESTASFEAAFAALPALPSVVSPPARLWKGDTARVILARYVRPATTTTNLNTYLVDLRAAPVGEALAQQKFMKTIRASDTFGGGFSDGMIAWTASTGVLTVGIDNGQATVNAVQTGWVLKAPGAPDHFASSTITGAGWTIPDGSALGYCTVFSSSVKDAFLSKKTLNDSPRQQVYQYTTTPGAFAPPQLTVEQLCVQPLDTFLASADRGSFIICTRMGSTLTWFNGHVTRGDSVLGVVDDFGGTPSPYTAIVSQTGQGTSNHATLVDAVDRVLNAITLGTGTLGNGRTVRIHIRAGSYTASSGIKKYGFADTAQTSAFASTNSAVELLGDGDLSTQVTFANPVLSGRASTDVGVCRISASKIVLKGITFSQTESSANPAAYLLDLRALEVVLEDCTFNGAVNIFADNVRIKQCKFNAGQTGSYTAFYAATSAYRYASCLYLASAVGGKTWRVEDCTFVGAPVGGTTSSVVISTSTTALSSVDMGLTCSIVNNVFTYGSFYSNTACIDVFGTLGHILIGENEFNGANGVIKAGVNSTSGTGIPFNYANVGGYPGTPLVDPVGSGISLSACAYISLTTGRDPTSSLKVRGNHFDLTTINRNRTGHLLMWGAFMAIHNTKTISYTSGTSITVCNITFSDNILNMYLYGFGLLASPWTGSATDQNTYMYGFYMAPLLADGGLTDVQYTNINVSRNQFDVGGDLTTTEAINRFWRGMATPLLSAWPSGTYEGTEASYLIGIILRNIEFEDISGLVNYAGRFANGLVISDNIIAERAQTGGNGPAYSQLTLGPSAYPRYHGFLITLDSGDFWYWPGQAYETNTASAYYMTNISTSPPTPTSPTPTGGLIAGPIISGNRVETAFYTADTTGFMNGAGIALNGVYGGIVKGNQIYNSSRGGSPSGIMAGISVGYNYVNSQQTVGYCTHVLVCDNVVRADWGIVGGVATNYISNNVLRGCSSPLEGTNTSSFVVTTGVTANNFT